MPDPLMTNRTEDNILWTWLTAVTAKGVYTVINIGHLSFLFLPPTLRSLSKQVVASLRAAGFGYYLT
jgi:hypothetical protein